MTKANESNQRRRGTTGATQPAGQWDKRADAAPPAPGHEPEYTPQQQEQVRAGLRVLARIIARAHLRWQTDRADLSPPPDRRAG